MFSELDYKNRLTPKTKEKQEHIKKLVSLIKKEGTFMHDGTSVIMRGRVETLFSYLKLGVSQSWLWLPVTTMRMTWKSWQNILLPRLSSFKFLKAAKIPLLMQCKLKKMYKPVICIIMLQFLFLVQQEISDCPRADIPIKCKSGPCKRGRIRHRGFLLE